MWIWKGKRYASDHSAAVIYWESFKAASIIIPAAAKRIVYTLSVCFSKSCGAKTENITDKNIDIGKEIITLLIPTFYAYAAVAANVAIVSINPIPSIITNCFIESFLASLENSGTNVNKKSTVIMGVHNETVQ